MEKLDKILRVAASKTWKMHTPKSTHIQLFLKCGSGLSKHASSLSLTPPRAKFTSPASIPENCCHPSARVLFTSCSSVSSRLHAAVPPLQRKRRRKARRRRRKGSLFYSGKQRLLPPCYTLRLKHRPALCWAQSLCTAVFRAFYLILTCVRTHCFHSMVNSLEGWLSQKISKHPLKAKLPNEVSRTPRRTLTLTPTVLTGSWSRTTLKLVVRRRGDLPCGLVSLVYWLSQLLSHTFTRSGLMS